jgi:hypothetical protein
MWEEAEGCCLVGDGVGEGYGRSDGETLVELTTNGFLGVFWTIFSEYTLFSNSPKVLFLREDLESSRSDEPRRTKQKDRSMDELRCLFPTVGTLVLFHIVLFRGCLYRQAFDLRLASSYQVFTRHCLYLLRLPEFLRSDVYVFFTKSPRYVNFKTLSDGPAANLADLILP